MNVVIIGAGKVGRALARALRRTRHAVRLLPARGRLAPLRGEVDLVVLAVRDGALAALAERLLEERVVPKRAAVVHVAGSLGPEVLAPLRAASAGVGQAHPLLSFASLARAPRFEGAHMLVAGDPRARQRASRLARALGMTPRRWQKVDADVYHAAAALTANGAAALAAAAARLLESAGAPRTEAVAALGPLLRSVAENVSVLGLPAALTGPVRRGDVATIERHLRALRGAPQDIRELYREVMLAQLGLATELGEAPPAALRALRRQLSRRPSLARSMESRATEIHRKKR